MKSSAFESKSIRSRNSRLSQPWSSAEPYQIATHPFLIVQTPNFHEPKLMKSSASETGLKRNEGVQHKIYTKTKHDLSCGTCKDKTTRIFLCSVFCWLMLQLCSYACAYVAPSFAGLTAFLCFAFCLFRILLGIWCLLMHVNEGKIRKVRNYSISIDK